MTDLPGLAKTLPWDSVFFGLKVARVLIPELKPVQIKEIDRWCERENVVCLYFLASSTGGADLTPVTQAGFELMDLRVTLHAKLSSINSLVEVDDPAFTLAEKADIPALRAIAANNHHDSRFYADPHFDPKRCDELYATWIEKAVLDPDQTVHIYKPGSQALGYYTTSMPTATMGEIGLVGLAPKTQGKGIGSNLQKHALHFLAQQGAESCEVVTQGRNIRALQLYEKSGFRIKQIHTWFHKWYR